MENSSGKIEGSLWQKNKLLIKGLIIVVLVLLLLIPANYIQDVIKEREGRQKEAATEVSSKWAGMQNITGPVLVVPYQEKDVNDTTGRIMIRKLAYFLPDELNIQSAVTPQKKHRGIYKIMLYSSVIRISGKFNMLRFDKLKIATDRILWQDAYVCIGITDYKGLKEEMKMKWNDSLLLPATAPVNNGLFRECFTSPVPLSEANSILPINFTVALSVNGSEQLLFTPVGKETIVRMQSSWPDPSFSGNILPDTSLVRSDGFEATWRSLAHTRNFPQEWTNVTYNLSASSFGVDLFIPVNGYQQIMRSVKYAVLCILLTFAAFFLIETVNKKSIHPVQYALIGMALVLFYSLLLSFSEYIGFDAAYIIASAAIIGLITWFVKSILKSMKAPIVMAIVLVLVYSYVFTILQLEDYALLMGSIGLFLTLGVIMYFSRKIQW